MSQKKSPPTTSSEISRAGKMGVFGLAGVVISSMIGGGIFSLPQNMAQSASIGAVLLAWIITGIGMYFIANSFRILSTAKPNLTTGIYMYSKEGFGSYMGFTIGWSYWLCQVFGNVGYAIITMDAMNYFFPGIFTGGNNLYSIIGGSFLIWGFNFLVLRGMQQASIVNLIATIAKMLPIFLFILILLFFFNVNKFDYDFWGQAISGKLKSLGPVSDQIKSTMLVTLWAFIGIEGAVVLSNRAKSQSDVGKATLIGFLGCLIIYILLSVLPYGFMTQAELAAVPDPSTAGVLEKAVGPWGAWLMNIGLIVATLASWLAWTMITAQMPQSMAEDGTMPKAFAKENQAGSPSVSLWVTSFAMQLGMLLVYFSNNAWNMMLSITAVMVLPAYLTSTAYLWKICEDGEYPLNAPIKRSAALITSILGSVYALWLIYAAGLNYLLMAAILIALGIPVYIWARKQNESNQPVFKNVEKGLVIIIIGLALFAIYALIRGIVKI